MAKGKDHIKEIDAKKILKKLGVNNPLNGLDIQLRIMETKFKKIVDRVWVDYTIYSTGRAHAVLGKNSSVQNRMNNVKKDAEENKAVEELGKQKLANMLRQVGTIYNKKDMVAFRADFYAAIDNLKATRIKQQAEIEAKNVNPNNNT